MPQLYRRILRPFYELVAPATVCELCITASVSDQSQATVPPTLERLCVILRPTAIVVYLQDYQALSMTPKEQDPGEHWLSLPENVLAEDTRSQTVVGFLSSLGRRCASKQPLLCHAGACELSSLGLNHPRVITFRPWSIAGS